MLRGGEYEWWKYFIYLFRNIYWVVVMCLIGIGDNKRYKDERDTFCFWSLYFRRRINVEVNDGYSSKDGRRWNNRFFRVGE